MNLKNVYDFSYKYLLSFAKEKGLTKEQVDDFITNPDKNANNIASFHDAYEELAIVLQDFTIFPNVIKYKERSNTIKEILHNFDLKYIANLEVEELYLQFKEKFGLKSEQMWKRYCKGLISGARFLLEFKNFDEFKSVLDSFDKNNMTRIALALYLSEKIHNMKFAIACNWLKELGYLNYSKPDTHIIDVCKAIGLIDEDDNAIKAFEAVAMVAKEAKVEAYTVDKVWWLICSGNFYRYDDIQIEHARKNKQDFLSELKKHFN